MRWRRRRILNFGRSLIRRLRLRASCLAADSRASRIARTHDFERPKKPGQIDHVVRG
jgi:hypothetical protein